MKISKYSYFNKIKYIKIKRIKNYLEVNKDE
jgi:hypothetical protein